MYPSICSVVSNWKSLKRELQNSMDAMIPYTAIPVDRHFERLLPFKGQ